VDEDRSLADEVAAWVPPWERPAEPTPVPAVEPDAQDLVEDDGSGGAEPLSWGDDTADRLVVDASGEGDLVEAAADLSEADYDAPDLSEIDFCDESGQQQPGEPDPAVVAAEPSPVTLEPAPAFVAADPSFSEEPLAPLTDDELRSALESIMLVVDEPVADTQLAEVLGEPLERVAFALAELSAEYTAAGRGFDLRRIAGGWRFYTRPENAAHVQRFVLDGQQARLTQAALETLAVIAYKQPVTRSRISAIRGVNCDGVTRTLVTRGLIEECGSEPENGAYLYRTTPLFLEKLGLDSVDQLPALAPFLPDDVEEIADA